MEAGGQLYVLAGIHWVGDWMEPRADLGIEGNSDANRTAVSLSFSS
jgi:hypothetical protein